MKIVKATMKNLKIVEINEDAIIFNDGSHITFDHTQDCCEYNYADFNAIDSFAKSYTFTAPIKFEQVDGYGFRFGDDRMMFGVPCYSSQNGYYSTEISIYYNNECMLTFDAQEDFC